MKKVAFVLFFFSATLLQAQSVDTIGVSSSLAGTSSTHYKAYPHYPAPVKSSFRIPGERMKKAGTTLTIVGGGLFIGGIFMISSGGTELDPNTGYYVLDDKSILGIYMVVYGAAMTVPGIILWTRGARKYKRYMEQQDSLSLGIKGVSGILVYKF